MPPLSSQDWTNIIIAAIGIIAYVYKTFIEPKQPAQKAAKINSEIATLIQAAALVVQKIEQQASSSLSPAQRKSKAIDDVKLLLGELGAPIPSVEAIDGAIESAVYLLKLAEAAAHKPATRQRSTDYRG